MIFFFIEGSATITLYTGSGKERVLSEITSHNMPVFFQTEHYKDSIIEFSFIVSTECHFVVIDKRELNPDEIINISASLIKSIHCLLEEQFLKSELRADLYLANYFLKNGVDDIVKIKSYSELSKKLSYSRVTLNNSINKLLSHNLLIQLKKKLFKINRLKLKEYFHKNI